MKRLQEDKTSGLLNVAAQALGVLFINTLQAVIDANPKSGGFAANWIQAALLVLGLGLLLCCKGELKRRAADLQQQEQKQKQAV